MDIMDGDQRPGEHFPRLDQVPDIGPGMIPAGEAGAMIADRPFIAGILGVHQVYPAPVRHGCAVTRQPGGEDTIKDVNPTPDTFDQVLRGTDAH